MHAELQRDSHVACVSGFPLVIEFKFIPFISKWKFSRSTHQFHIIGACHNLKHPVLHNHRETALMPAQYRVSLAPRTQPLTARCAAYICFLISSLMVCGIPAAFL